MKKTTGLSATIFLGCIFQCSCASELVAPEIVPVSTIEKFDSCEQIRIKAFNENKIDLDELTYMRRKDHAPFFASDGALAGIASCESAKF